MARRIICYPLKPKGGSNWNNNELRHSLRSVAQHWKGEYDAVYILGAWMPDWINGEEVSFALAPQYLQALEKAVSLAGEGGDILWMNDDILFMKDTSWEDLVNPVRRERVDQMDTTKAKQWSKSDNGWMRRLGEIMLGLHEMGCPTWKFSTHTPYWYEADLLKESLRIFGHLGYKVAIENAYYNMNLDKFDIEPCMDKFRISKKRKRFPMARIDDVRFLNLTPNISPWMQGFIRGRWWQTCKFEKPEK